MARVRVCAIGLLYAIDATLHGECRQRLSDGVSECVQTTKTGGEKTIALSEDMLPTR
jgi:hypothetical protein